MTMLLAGMSRPNAPRSAFKPTARPMPATNPMVEATRPTITASNSTEPRTWRWPAPMARSSASSRLRCATTIENVLKMMNEPTSSATTAKISRNVLKNERLSFRLLWLSAVMSFPLITSIFEVPGSDFERGADVADDLVLRDARTGLHVDRLELTGRAQHARRGGRRERGDGGAEQAVRAAELHDAGERVVVAPGLGDDRHRGAHLVAGVVGAPLVDDDLVGSPGTPALHDVDRAQVTVVDEAETERRRALAVAAERVALLVDDDRQSLHRPVGRGHAVGAAHRREQVGPDRAPALVAEALTAELLFGPHDRVGVLVDVVEEPVERVGDGRGEHERARHERDPQHHRDAGEQEANLLGPDPLERDLPHVARRPGSSSCRARNRHWVRTIRRRSRRRRGTPPGRRSPRRWGRG